MVRPKNASLCEYFDPFNARHLQSPYQHYARLRADSPIHYATHLGMWIVSRYSDIAQLLRRTADFSSRKALGGNWTLRHLSARSTDVVDIRASAPEVRTMVASDGADHALFRRLTRGLFTPTAMLHIRPIIENTVDEHIGTVLAPRKATRLDVVTDLAKPIPAKIIAHILGLPASLAPVLADYAHDKASMWSRPGQSTRLLTEDLSRRSLDLYLSIFRTMHELEGSDGDTIIEVLLRAPEAKSGEVSQPEIAAFVLQMIVMGIETTSAGIASTLAAVARPDVQRQLRRHEQLIPLLVDEAVRLESPAQATWRVAWCDTYIGHQLLPAGAPVMLLLGSANRDESKFHSAETMILGRAGQHLAFGLGTHYCIGASLARVQIQSVVARLLACTSSIRLLPGAVRDTNMVARRFTRLPLELIRRCP